MLSTIPLQSTRFGSEDCGRAVVRSQPRRVLIATQNVSPGVDAELIRHIFQEANRVPDGEPAYSIEFIALEESHGSESCQCGTHNMAQAPASLASAPDTLFITGPYNPDLCTLQPEYLDLLRRQCARSRRIVAVAGGTIYLAAINLLKGHVAVSHWSLHQHLESRYPGISVRSDILYTQDGNVYTCAGALASVDLALRLVEDDLGGAVTAHIARQMLLPLRRTASCSQVSSTLQAQNNASNPILNLLAWLPNQLASNLSIPKLARRVAMSPRNFARRFREQVKQTPARYIEELRFEAAKRELALEGQSIGEAAQRSGFQNPESLRRLFQRRLGVTPKVFRDQMMSVELQ